MVVVVEEEEQEEQEEKAQRRPAHGTIQWLPRHASAAPAWPAVQLRPVQRHQGRAWRRSTSLSLGGYGQRSTAVRRSSGSGRGCLTGRRAPVRPTDA